MITYLLHGGATSKNHPGNRRFFTKLTALVNKASVKILLCCWARPQPRWEQYAKRDTQKILSCTTKSVQIHTVENPNELHRLIPQFDVLYVTGGEAELLEPYYDKLKFLKDRLEGKVYAGSSMGAFLASENYVLSFEDNKPAEVHQGVGLLPIQTLCHWNVEKQKQLKLKLLQSSNKPIITLNEGEFVEVYCK
ncbi:MAG: Type 1 glutamine amidotransferase-like domain-containing protein [Patescibacteria group bacterium]|nr:Type 1 glutamine amidotransferase-like domain-containing protein [Patescibacteria group bacterium]